MYSYVICILHCIHTAKRLEETFMAGHPWIWYWPPRLLYWLASTAPMHLDHTLEGRGGREEGREKEGRKGGRKWWQRMEEGRDVWRGGERSELQGRKEGR